VGGPVDLTPDPRLLLERLAGVLSRYSFRYATEVQLHRAIAQVLEREGIAFDREAVDGDNRYDFLCGGIVLEVKMDRSGSEAFRQVDRYCASERVHAVVLVTTKSWSTDATSRTTVRGKPVVMVRIRGQAF
jgi:hypothetical protein